MAEQGLLITGCDLLENGLKSSRLNHLRYTEATWIVCGSKEVLHPHPFVQGKDGGLPQLHAMGVAVHQLVGTGGCIIANLHHIMAHSLPHIAPLGIGEPIDIGLPIPESNFRGLWVDKQGQIGILRHQLHPRRLYRLGRKGPEQEEQDGRLDFLQARHGFTP